MDFKYVSPSQVYSRLTMEKCIGLMREVFTAFSTGEIENRLRSVMPAKTGGIMGIMPALLPYDKAVGAKLITVFHDNYKKGLPSHQGVVAVFDSENGRLRGICDGTAVTAVRTGAVSALATDLMADKNSRTLALFGAGVQADMHLKAISCVRPIDTVYIWCPDIEESRLFAQKHRENYPQIKFIRCESGKSAAENADIICTLTPSHTPVLQGDWVKKGAHINAVGACAAKDRELDSRCVAKGRFICDSLDSCHHESGDYLFPLEEGVISPEHILGTLGDVVAGRVDFSAAGKDITIFEALGLACEDLACASWLLK